MKIRNQITQLLGIKYPIIQGGMSWVSYWELVSKISNCGGLGLLAAGSMKSEILEENIVKCRENTSLPFGVNIPLLRGDASELIQVCLDCNVKIFFTAAGSPDKYIDLMKKNNSTVIHVVSSVKQGLKAQNAGCDAIVGEGVEAGGHNGKDEITTFCLIPQLVDELKIPVIAAGGIADGRGIAAAMSLGAQGVQIGTLFAATNESIAHMNYKNAICNSKDESTILTFKKIGMLRMLKNKLSEVIIQAEAEGASKEELLKIFGHKKEQAGILNGDTENGIMEAGQISGMIKEIKPAEVVFKKLLTEFDEVIDKLQTIK
ncbi:MAG: nitronate monooxygenase [Ignavibacteriales bacterium]|nr:nitronate monooxygenase [Ignavibacteriales bacterium]